MRFIATIVLGTLFAIVTVLLVLVYWLTTIVFRTLYVVTLPLHWLWQSLQRAP